MDHQNYRNITSHLGGWEMDDEGLGDSAQAASEAPDTESVRLDFGASDISSGRKEMVADGNDSDDNGGSSPAKTIKESIQVPLCLL